MSFQRLFPTFPIPHFGHAVALAKVVAYALTRIKSGLLDGTVSVWQINEGVGTVIDDVVGVNDGTIYGATWTTTAKSGGYALSFDGIDDYVEIPDEPSLNPTNAITLECWVRLNAFTGDEQRFITKIGVEPAWAPQYHLIWNEYLDQFHFMIGIGGTEYSVFGVTASTGVWYHVVGTYDGSTMKLYVDGVEVDSAAVSGAIDVVATPVYLGKRVDNVEYLNGILDEVRIYNRALSADEIAERYNYGLKVRITNLLEGQKVELYDSADVLKASYTVGVGETEAILDVATLTFPFEGYFKIYDVDGVTLLLKTGIYTDIWGGDVYKFETL